MHTLNEVSRFLQAIFPNYLTSAIFANLNPPNHTRDYTKLDAGRDCYWSIAAFPEGVTSNRKDHALDVRALVVDDVGTKVSALAVELGLGLPTAIVESSPGNFQYVYRLAQAVPKEAWGAFFDAAEKRVREKFDPATRDAVHLFRLPMGVNTKPDRGGFRVRLTHLDPRVVLTLPIPAVSMPEAPGEVAGHGSVSLPLLEALMKLVPNDATVDRDVWVDVGHGLKALCENDDEGFAVFDAWSAPHASYDAGKTRKAWDSFGAGGLRTQGGKLRALVEGRDREGFRAWDAKLAFDPGPNDPFPDLGVRTGITATPYQWVDPDKLPPRDWLYGNILIRQFISMTVAPGGVGKSSLTIVEALAMVTGRNLLGEKPAGKLRVWLWNLEDPIEETQRRIQAACLHYGITEADIGGRLFVDSGRDQKLVVATMDRSGGPMIVKPVVADLVGQIKTLEIDVTVVDPFVSCHEVSENDNTAQDMVVKEWGRVSGDGGCAVHLIDHARKTMAGVEITTDSSRGGKAKTDAARVVRVVNRMSADDGTAYQITDTWKYFNTFNDKANMAPPVDRRDWFHLESVGLGNGVSAAVAFGGGVGSGMAQGDQVGVVARWMPPSPQDLVNSPNFKAMVEAMGTGEWRKNYQAGDNWIGNAAAKALGLDPHHKKNRKTINTVVAQWIKSKLLAEVPQLDKQRKEKIFIQIVGGV